MIDAPQKQCTNPDCLQWHPATPEFFYRNKSDLTSRCKSCINDYNRRPEVLERDRKRKKNEYSRPDVRARRATWHHNNLELWKNYKHVRRARQKDISGTHTPEQIQDLLKRQKHKCYYCSIRLKRIKGKYIYHIDHTFPLSRVAGSDIPANDISYLVLTCPTCNKKKRDKFPWEFAEGGRLL